MEELEVCMEEVVEVLLEMEVMVVHMEEVVEVDLFGIFQHITKQ